MRRHPGAHSGDGGFLKYEGPALVEYDLTPAVHSLEDVAELDRLARSSGKPLRYHLKIDSGMSRLGTRAGSRGDRRRRRIRGPGATGSV